MLGAEWGRDQPCPLGRCMAWMRLSLVGTQREWGCDLQCGPAHTPMPTCACVRDQNEAMLSSGPQCLLTQTQNQVTPESQDPVMVRCSPQRLRSHLGSSRLGLGLPVGWPECNLCQPVYEPPPPGGPEPLLVSVGSSSGRERVSSLTQDIFNPCSPELG